MLSVACICSVNPVSKLVCDATSHALVLVYRLVTRHREEIASTAGAISDSRATLRTGKDYTVGNLFPANHKPSVSSVDPDVPPCADGDYHTVTFPLRSRLRLLVQRPNQKPFQIETLRLLRRHHSPVEAPQTKRHSTPRLPIPAGWTSGPVIESDLRPAPYHTLPKGCP